jgi:hypothetical protein
LAANECPSKLRALGYWLSREPLNRADAQLTAANATVSKDEADLTEALERRREFDPLERFLVSLPTPLQAIKTDAQGKFSFKAPGGVYFLLARATRAVVGPQENYVWVLKVDTRSQSQDVLLTNDNQIQTGCDSCLPWPPR